ncbi:MFS transporter [Marininema halotolerans]|uniref:Transmembrane secretion effector n=1 Tax=Marininema halotolerans TaxID=1155944 RepID=A0A1I6S6X7_9BACL|nr:MFS transporter [Marininema halotolerans]SFS72528.1 Transmembrane secretion effector [Marininema halotolerans]
MNKFPPPFYALWIGQGIANLADSLYTIAMVTMLYTMSGSATMAASFPLVRMGAMMLGGFIAPLLFERWRLHRILLVSQLGQTMLLAILAIMTSGKLHPLYSLLLVLCISFLDGWTTPTRNALLPQLIPSDLLMRGNSWLATTDQTVMLLGWASGGLLVTWMGSDTLLWGCVILFSISCLALAPVRVPKSPSIDATTTPSRWQTLKQGWLMILHNPSLRRITWMDAIETVASSIWVGAIMLVFVKEVLHRGSIWWSWMNTSYLLGTVLGGVLILALSRLLAHRLAIGMLIGSTCNSFLVLLFALVPYPFVSLALCVLMGPCYQLRDITQQTLFQQAIPADVLPKAFSAHGTLMYGIFGLGVVINGAIADHFGARSVYLVASVLLISSVLIGAPMLKNQPSSAKTRSSITNL